jgi:hypothetical protein
MGLGGDPIIDRKGFEPGVKVMCAVACEVPLDKNTHCVPIPKGTEGIVQNEWHHGQCGPIICFNGIIESTTGLDCSNLNFGYPLDFAVEHFALTTATAETIAENPSSTRCTCGEVVNPEDTSPNTGDVICWRCGTPQ